MPNWDKKRWVRQRDGSYRRRQTAHLQLPTAYVAEGEKPIYANMTLARLRAECERRGLKTYGSKATIAERLEKHDAEQRDS